MSNQEEFEKANPYLKQEMMMEEAIASAELAMEAEQAEYQGIKYFQQVVKFSRNQEKKKVKKEILDKLNKYVEADSENVEVLVADWEEIKEKICQE